MRRVAASILILLGMLVTVDAGHASLYGARRLGVVQVRFDDGEVVAIVDAYVVDGGNAVADPEDPWAGYASSLVCAAIYTPTRTTAGCGDGTIQVAWPLLDSARISAHVGSIEVELEMVERGLPRPSPMLELGLGGPFAHGGLVTFRPGHATGSVLGPSGGVSGETDIVGLYSMTSAYGEPF